MKDYFKGVRRRIGKLDANQLREQYEILSGEALALDTLFRTITLGIVLVDENGAVEKSNPAAKSLLGMEPADAIGEMGLPCGKSSKREISISYPESRVLEIQTVPLERQTLVYIRDITAEKVRSEEELQAGAFNAVRDLASGVAHEIGNPLNALSLNLQLLETNPPDASKIIRASRHQIDRLTGILKGFLSALRPSRPNLVPAAITIPLTNCLSALKAQFEEHRITVTVDVQRTLPSTAIDVAQMEQVFFNLLKNSLEAIRDGGEIGIKITYDDNDVLVAIKDSGLGMSPEQVSHLFEPYRTSKEHGTGLGLMVTARLVRDHGGTIAVESGIGSGTTFTLRIPRLEKRIRALN